MKPGRAGQLVAWEEIEAYSDDSADYVQLRVRGARPDPAHTIPTRDAHDRTAVLAELDRRGLVRREGP